MNILKSEIQQCNVCSPVLELGVRPIFSVSASSKILIIGQAPGIVVHKSGVPWNDKSGENLRRWLGIDVTTFYDSSKIGIVPMGFCYPGKGKSGDLPPRKECAPLWHHRIFEELTQVELIVLIGKYAQDYYLTENRHRNLTETVKNFQQFLPQFFVLPHPSPRNNIWQAKNSWFGAQVLPELKNRVRQIISEN